MRVAARVLSVVAPRLPVIAVDPALVSRDPEVVRAYETDPLVFHGKLSARTVAELAAAVESLPSGIGAITTPVLILWGSADGLVPPRGSEMIAERIGSEDKTSKAYEGLHHEILNEPEQDQVLDDITAWLDSRVPSSVKTE
jgi:alpha-beta hydrolase superfamily lysophospholipase